MGEQVGQRLLPLLGRLRLKGKVEERAVRDQPRVADGPGLREAELVDEVVAEERRIDGVGVETRQRTVEQDLKGAGQLFLPRARKRI
ncbi:hypothetical protein ABT120_29700 [Nonomuraea angiospora]|uniref:hypothetical protein n=1 Tax=Nonomuraea angiospora TaxID=46172 RepID=UPI00333161F9